MTPALLLLIPTAFASTLIVDASGDGEYATIQAAADAASDGDILAIVSGTYIENISITAKNLTLQGDGSSTVTIIGDGSTAALSIEDGNAWIWGVAIMDGKRGIVMRNGSLELDDVLIQNNGGATLGGGLAVLESARVTGINTTISNNNAEDGGGLYLEEGTVVSFTDSSISSNTATGAGGGVHSLGTLSLIGSTLSDNLADGNGGALYAAGPSPAILTTNFFSNQANKGGAIYLDGTTTGDTVAPLLLESDLAYNQASDSGGAIAISGSSEFYLKLVVAWMNNAGGDGGALHAENTALLKLTYARFFYNTAANGGGFYATGLGGGETRKSRFGGNEVTGNGGGAYYADPTDRAHTIHNNTYIENIAEQGGGLYISGDPSQRHAVLNIDAVGNTGDGIAIKSSTDARVINANTVGNTGVGLRVDSDSMGGTFKHNNSVDNDTDWGGALSDLVGTDGNISQDPLYRSYTNGDAISDFLYLEAESPCIDAGKGDLFDVDGSVSDIGSYGGADAEANDDDEDGVGPFDGDCDDGDPTVGPEQAEIWHNGRDNDCLGADDFDQDEDGYRYGQGDCNDEDPTIYPGADDPPGDGIDQNCDGSEGEGGGDGDSGSTPGGDSGTTTPGGDTGTTPGADTGAPWVPEGDTGGDPFADADNDGFVQSEDCNDADPDANLDADEVCDDGVDNDCDGKADDADADCMGGAKGCKCASVSDAPALGWMFLIGLGAMFRRTRRGGE